MNGTCKPMVQYSALFYDNEYTGEDHLVCRWEVYATVSFTFEMFRQSALKFANTYSLTVDIVMRVYCG